MSKQKRRLTLKEKLLKEIGRYCRRRREYVADETCFVQSTRRRSGCGGCNSFSLLGVN